MLLNCGVGEDSWGSRRLQGDPTSPSLRKSVLNIHWKDWCWSWNSNIWPPDVKNWLTGKDPDAGKYWRKEEKGMIEDEMVRWHHWLNGHGFGWTPRVGDRQGGLACYGSWGRKESDMTVWLNWTEPTPVFWPGEVREQRSLAGYSSWGHKELDMTERQTTTTATQYPSVVSAVKSSPKGKCWGNNEQSHVQV